jgi:CRP-like cAMP-binding protein
MPGPGREPTVSDEEIIDTLREASDPVLTTAEVADAIGLGRRGTFDRLKRLSKEGEIRMKKVGETGAVWWHPQRTE